MAVVLLLYLIAEIAAIWAVASVVGVLWTIVLLLAGAVLGTWLARREGRKVAGALMSAARAGRPGYREVTDGMLVTLGGLLILVPGFITDIAGLLVMLPPARSFLRRAWERRLQRNAGSPGRAGGSRRAIIVDSEIVSRPPNRPGDGPEPGGPSPHSIDPRGGDAGGRG